MVYLICSQGTVVFVVESEKSPKEIYEEYVGQNHGDYIVELDEHSIKEILSLR